MPIDYTAADYDFAGQTDGFAEKLDTAFDLQQTNVEAVDAMLAQAITALFAGTGREPGGCTLAAGTGLSATLTNDGYWIAGRRYEVAAGVGTSTVSLPASQTSYVYQDATGLFTCYATQPATTPAGYWYVGTATTDSTSCTAVDQTDCDEIATVTDMAALKTAIGWPYTDAATIVTRLAALEAGSSGGGGLAYWLTMPKAPGDVTTPSQEMDAKDTAAVAAHVAALHGATSGDGTGTAVPDEPWDVDAVNQALALMQEIAQDNDTAGATQVDTVILVPGVYGDGTGTTPDYVDRVNSTWTTGLTVPA